MSASSRDEKPFQPMHGVRIVDFSTNMAGPFATMILAQLGADVIKVETASGDDARAWPPIVDGQGITHRHMNAGKRGIVLDLKVAEGQAVALDLVACSHVLLQSMRPGTADRIGIGEAAVRAVNPDILYYALSAFGDGPTGRGMPGYDPLVQAYSGVMAMNGHEGSPPARCAPSLIDLGTGQWIAMGILAATLAAARGVAVRAMDTALFDTALSVVPYQAASAKRTGQRPPRAGSGNPIAAPYQCYLAVDGDVMIAAPSERLWLKLIAVLGAPQLAQEARFRTVADRAANNAELTAALSAILATETVQHWVDKLTAAGVPATKVQGLHESVSGAIACERRSFLDNDGLSLVRLPWLVDGAPLGWSGPAPRLGEHTIEVLRELGYGEQRIESLLGSGAATAESGAGVATETAHANVS
ncbi:MAG TPA: CoA transferase [Xanthobacteraceae bacterium]|nr:CoA transferase [Xanthobacteraceae bacterium]